MKLSIKKPQILTNTTQIKISCGICHILLLFNLNLLCHWCFQTEPFSLVSPPLTTYNQQLWLTCVMQAGNSNSTSFLPPHLNALSKLHYQSFYLPNKTKLLSASVKDFKQNFEINVDLKGEDASVMHIKSVQQKSRMLHCGAVSYHTRSAPRKNLMTVLAFSKVMQFFAYEAEMRWDHCAAPGLPELHSVSRCSQLPRPWKHLLWNQG